MRYEYGTSPRKYIQDDIQRKKVRTSKTIKQKVNNKKQITKKNSLNTYLYCGFALIIAFAFLVSIRSSKIEQRNVQIQAEKKEIEQIKNENVNLNTNLQKALSLTNIEKQAKDKLGMQKLKNSQIRYVKLDKQDYIEPVSVTRIDEKQESLWSKIVTFFSF